MKNINNQKEGKKESLFWLKVICVAVWLMVIVVIGVSLKVFCFDSGKDTATTQTQLPQKVEKSVLIVGDNNHVVYNLELETSKSYKKAADERKARVTGKALKILEATAVWSDDFTLDDAVKLADLIEAAAYRHGLNKNEAFLIPHIESDYRVDAYNKHGNAWGLTQVTPPCLTEYNNNHTTKYTIKEMLDPEKNLEVGFWYYARLLKHYSKYPEYGITLTSEETAMRDAYISYNFGITLFRNVGRWGRNELRQGRYPINIYGCKIGDRYEPYFRFKEISAIWLES